MTKPIQSNSETLSFLESVFSQARETEVYFDAQIMVDRVSAELPKKAKRASWLSGITKSDMLDYLILVVLSGIAFSFIDTTSLPQIFYSALPNQIVFKASDILKWSTVIISLPMLFASLFLYRESTS